MVLTDVPFPCSSSGWNIRSGVGGRRGAAGGCHRNKDLVVQREQERSVGRDQARFHLGKDAGLGEGWRRVRPSPFPASSHRLSQDVAAFSCAGQDR